MLTVRLVVYQKSKRSSVGTINSFAGLRGNVHPVDVMTMFVIKLFHDCSCIKLLPFSQFRYSWSHLDGAAHTQLSHRVGQSFHKCGVLALNTIM